jgi:ansamitocin polyketide synthase A
MGPHDLIRPLPDLLAAHAVSRGDQVAFSDSRRAIGFAALERRTARLAGHLAHAGVRPGDRVVIFLANRVEAVECCLAVTRAAAVGVPLDLCLPTMLSVQVTSGMLVVLVVSVA